MSLQQASANRLFGNRTYQNLTAQSLDFSLSAAGEWLSLSLLISSSTRLILTSSLLRGTLLREA